MKKSVSVLKAIAAAVMLGAFAAAPVSAQDKGKAPASEDKKASAGKASAGKVTQKILLENEKAKALEVRFKPGDQGASVARPARVVRALKGGTLMRTYPDGKTEKVEWKTGQVKFLGPDPAFAPKNVGKSEVVLYVVELK